MKTTEIKKLIAVTAIACLPVACGTNSPMGPDVAAVEGDFTAAAFRYEPGQGPSAPEGGGTETAPLPTNEVPAPTVPETNEVPAPTVPETNEVPAPAPTRGRRPVPQPSPSAPSDDAGSIPTPPTAPAPAPAPPTGPSTETPSSAECLAASIEIVNVSTFAGTGGLSLEAILLGKDGLAITDASCEKVLWDVDSSALGDRVVITYGASSRYVTVSGPAGTYTISAITPNKQSAALSITLY